jgi:hypothetical protein
MWLLSNLAERLGGPRRRTQRATESSLRALDNAGVLADYFAATTNVDESAATIGESRPMEPSVLMYYFDRTLTSPRLRGILDRAKADAGRA